MMTTQMEAFAVLRQPAFCLCLISYRVSTCLPAYESSRHALCCTNPVTVSSICLSERPVAERERVSHHASLEPSEPSYSCE